MFRRDPVTRTEWSPESASGCAKRQAEILEEASRLVRSGGRLVYSTCTYNPEENEKTIFRFLKSHHEFETESIYLNGRERKDGMILCLPHRMKGEGQFTALLRKKGNNRIIELDFRFSSPEKKAKNLLMETVAGIPEPNGIFGNTMIRVPECPDLKGVRVLRAGLQIAELRGNNPVPDHAAAMSFLKNSVQTVALEPEEVQQYIAGAEIPGNAKGWCMLTYRGLILGWGKGSNGTIKNHYPKGLRKDRILTETGG